jgi:hypothetical protein
MILVAPALGTPASGVATNLTGTAASLTAGAVSTIAGLAPNTATTQATQGAITSAANLATVGTITTGVWSGTDVAVAAGGTGSSTAGGARTNLDAAKTSKKFFKIFSGGLSAFAALDTGMTSADFGDSGVDTSGGGAHTTEVYFNGQLLLGADASGDDYDYYEHGDGVGNIAFEFAAVAGDILQVIVR